MRGFARRSRADLVFGDDAVQVGRVLDHFLVGVRSLGRSADADPARAVGQTSLDLVAGHRRAAVTARGRPRQLDGRFARFGDGQLLRSSRDFCKHQTQDGG